MAKFLKTPDNAFDRDLLEKGKRRAQELAQVIAVDTGRVDSEGNPIFTFGSVYREKIVDVVDNVKPVRKGVPRMKVEPVTKVKGKQYTFAKAPREGSKLAQAVKLVAATGKDDKPACLDVLVKEMSITKGNASIYFAKAQAIIQAGL